MKVTFRNISGTRFSLAKHEYDGESLILEVDEEVEHEFPNNELSYYEQFIPLGIEIVVVDSSEMEGEVVGGAGTPGKDGKDGKDGVDGATFIPSIDEEGNLSWSNDKGLENPPTVNIRGLQGEKGQDGVDGKDGKDVDPKELNEVKERVQVLETINLETKPYIDKNGMLVLCGCPAIIRPNTNKQFDADADETDVIVSIRFFNDELDKFVFTADEFAKTRICMGYGAEGVGTKRNIVETTLELYDLDKVFIIDGGSQITGEIGTVNIIAERCNYIDGIQGARAMNGGERNIVHNFNVKVTDCKLIDTLYGGGNGYSVVWNSNIEVNGDTEINFLIAGGSNGYTRKGHIEVNGGLIHILQGVNRGILDRAELILNGGVVDKFYAAGDSEDASVTGVQFEAYIELNGGTIDKFDKGNSKLEEFKGEIEGHIKDTVVTEGNVSMLEKVE